MEHYLDEKIVMKFYLDQLDQDNIVFLQGKDEQKALIREDISNLIAEDKMNNKIQIAVGLWKKLFESAMSYISPKKNGYDKILGYFDSYVEFEELIFASDSFYRDHTLHCLWVYFLGEYIARRSEFDSIFESTRSANKSYMVLGEVSKELQFFSAEEQRTLDMIIKEALKSAKMEESVRCIAAITHDLGYPLKKIEKINKSIRKVLPYYGINSFTDFNFEYGNIQKDFVDSFIDFISRRYFVNFKGFENYGDLFTRIFNIDDYGNLRSIRHDEIAKLTDEERELLKGSIKLDNSFIPSFRYKALYNNDFENYQHGIMSAFLLMKNLEAFQDIDYNPRTDRMSIANSSKTLAIYTILTTITDHTCDGYRIHTIDDDSFLTFVDELEEFSRISRASQNREYVEEFCDSAIYMEDGWFNVVFEFNNKELDNLDPERAFKGRCKRFLSLFDIPHMDPHLKIRVKVVGKLPTDENEYVLEIARKHAHIFINGEEKVIPKYLKSTQFYTCEEYAEIE